MHTPPVDGDWLDRQPERVHEAGDPAGARRTPRSSRRLTPGSYSSVTLRSGGPHFTAQLRSSQ